METIFFLSHYIIDTLLYKYKNVYLYIHSCLPKSFASMLWVCGTKRKRLWNHSWKQCLMDRGLKVIILPPVPTSSEPTEKQTQNTGGWRQNFRLHQGSVALDGPAFGSEAKLTFYYFFHEQDLEWHIWESVSLWNGQVLYMAFTAPQASSSSSKEYRAKFLTPPGLETWTGESQTNYSVARWIIPSPSGRMEYGVGNMGYLLTLGQTVFLGNTWREGRLCGSEFFSPMSLTFPI